MPLSTPGEGLHRPCSPPPRPSKQPLWVALRVRLPLVGSLPRIGRGHPRSLLLLRLPAPPNGNVRHAMPCHLCCGSPSHLGAALQRGPITHAWRSDSERCACACVLLRVGSLGHPRADGPTPPPSPSHPGGRLCAGRGHYGHAHTYGSLDAYRPRPATPPAPHRQLTGIANSAQILLNAFQRWP